MQETKGGKNKGAAPKKGEVNGWWEGVPWLTDEDVREETKERWEWEREVVIASVTQIGDILRRMKAQKELEELREDDEMIIVGTGAHWLMIRVQQWGSKRLQVLETFGEDRKLTSTDRLVRILRNKGWMVELVRTGVQDKEDGNTCGYHVCRWVKEIRRGKK